MPRIRRIIDIGSGIHPHKAVGLAARHSKSRILGVEKGPVNLIPSLQRHGLSTIPTNLEIHANTHVRALLRRTPNDQFSHAYSYLVLDNMSTTDRIHTIHEVYRTLQPGATYTILATGEHVRSFTRELSAAGFVISTKSLSLNQVKKMGSESTEFNANLVTTVLASTGYHTASQQKKREMQEVVYQGIVAHKRSVEPVLSGIEKRVLREVREDIERFFTHPFVLLKAKKRRK